MAAVRAAIAGRNEVWQPEGDRARELLNAAQIGVFEIEAGRLMYANDYLVEMSKYSKEELLAMDLRKLVCPKDAERLLRTLSERVRGVLPQRPSTYCFVAKDGTSVKSNRVTTSRTRRGARSKGRPAT